MELQGGTDQDVLDGHPYLRLHERLELPLCVRDTPLIDVLQEHGRLWLKWDVFYDVFSTVWCQFDTNLVPIWYQIITKLI